MPKYVQTGVPRKTVGAYLRAVKALNELETQGEILSLHPYRTELRGILGAITQNPETGEWTFVQSA